MRYKLLLLLFVLIGGCRVHQVVKNPNPGIEIPSAFSTGESSKTGENRWWLRFNDPQLNRLIDMAMQGNLQLRGAWARIEQARAMAKQAAAGWQPKITAKLGYARKHSVFYPGGRLGKLEQTANNYNVDIGASYEIDAWGRVASRKDAADLDTLAVRMDTEAMAMSMAAQVALAWFKLREMTATRALLEHQLEVNRTYLRLVRFRFDQGLGNLLDVLQEKQQLAAIRAQLPNVDAGMELAKHQLAVLLGKPPTAQVAGQVQGLPGLPHLPPTGVPADLLGQRPDVRAARLRIVAVDHRLAAAIADWLPALSLNASTGFMAQDITKLLQSWIWSLGASLFGTIWDGGRMLAEQQRLKARIKELTARYGQVVLTAMKEVEDALVQNRQQERYIKRLQEQLNAAKASLKTARERYSNGLIDYLPVLKALQGVQQVERALIAAKAQALNLRVQLCRALGGTWTRGLRSPYRKQAKGDK